MGFGGWDGGGEQAMIDLEQWFPTLAAHWLTGDITVFQLPSLDPSPVRSDAGSKCVLWLPSDSKMQPGLI